MENKMKNNYQNISIARDLKNTKGKQLLAKNALEYSREIVLQLQENPGLLEPILSELEMTSRDFLEYLSGFKIANITFYDETLSIIRSKSTHHSR